MAESQLVGDAEGRLQMEAIVYRALGRAADADAALAELKAKFGDFCDIKKDLHFNTLANDPQFRALLRRMKLPA